MDRTNNKYTIGDYSFSNKGDYERALKEKEAISYIVANTNMADMKSVLKVYNRSVEKKSFQTVLGLEFVRNMRKNLINSGIVSDDTIQTVPVPPANSGKLPKADNSLAHDMAEKYKLAYENEHTGMKIRNMVIVFLVVVIGAMMFITYNSKYSVFTYFTDYEANMENELVDKYQEWKKQLEEKENELNERERALGNK
ncbi:MAG: hypothetical protein HFH68_04435 [Lachnospiraceae bacterium]|nr:hypothetical protein [Lachnospiraceae bacterium]